MHAIPGVIHGKTIELTDDPGLPAGNEVQVVLWPIRSSAAIDPLASAMLPAPPGWRPGGTETAAGMLADLWTKEDDEILADIERDRQSSSWREITE